MSDTITTPPRGTFLQQACALLAQRCPRCRRGKIFRKGIVMNDPCPHCGLVFEREPGYLLGAMYFSYFLSIAIMAPLFYLCLWLLPPWNQMLVALVAFVVYLPLVPFVFRYSRVLWIHYDRLLAPSDLSDHGGWLKWRERQRDK
jgi:uncharacterized protein (DUF983 family)